MTLQVAVTRAEPEAAKTAARLRALGAEPILTPLLQIEARAIDTDFAGAQALLFTSANGVRAFGAQTTARAFAVLTVGDATAMAAREAGFADVRSADGDALVLIEAAADALDPKAGRVIHISGAHVAHDIAAALRARGFDAERRIAYEAKSASALPAALLAPVDIVLFHSARAAEIYCAFGAPGAEHRIAACLSPAVAAATKLGPQGPVLWKRHIVAPRPREDALLRAALS